MAMRNGNAQISSSIDTIARSLTASDSKVTSHMVMKPSIVEGMVSKLVSKVPKLRYESRISYTAI